MSRPDRRSSYTPPPPDDDLGPIDPELRLRTTRTAHSVIAESLRSEALADDRKRKRRKLFRGMTMSRKGTIASLKTVGRKPSGASDGASVGVVVPELESAIQPDVVVPEVEEKKEAVHGARRSVYVNIPLKPEEMYKGEPIVRYVRNKVRTSKYTLLTFVPKNLFEQFRRVANIYFLGLVVLQVFPIFGASTPEIAMLPLVAILIMTGIKDGVEDWRRERLDNEVNNSAATKLGDWRNVNQPTDGRTLFEKLFRIGRADGAPSKGVRKLRDREAKDGKRIVMERRRQEEQEEELVIPPSLSNATGRKDSYPLETIQSIAGSEAPDPADVMDSEMLYHATRPRRSSLSSSAHSFKSRASAGVIEWDQSAAGTAHWERTLWKKLEVGDIVLLRDNEQVPADIIVLSTSDSDNLCFVETKNLDGETNLKVRRALKATSSINAEEDLEHAKFIVDSEPPHANLYTYNGVLKYHSSKGGPQDPEKIEPITINELLLRGCSLRNTSWVIGLVIFTGADTKIMLNGGDTPSKRSKIEMETNFNVIMNFLILMLLCIVTAVLHGWYRTLSHTSAQYYEPGAAASDSIPLDSIIIFASCLIVFQNIVPISLYISIEIVKTIQAYFIFQDKEMYYAPYDTPCVPKTWNISDDLGQIEYVFSDKTGTLTQNIMEFKKCSINGVTFGEGLTEAMMGAAKREGRDLGMSFEDQAVGLAVSKEKMVETMNRAFKNRYLQADKLTLVAPDLAQHLADRQDPLRGHIIKFFRALAICHSVLADKPEPTKFPHKVDYKAESPDEAALVAAARDAGFPFVARTTNRIDIEVLGASERWTPLRVLEFNSTRKRMSVIARDPENRIVLFCKGADSVIYERLAADHDPVLKADTLRDLETFANGGLRTLCISYRYLTEEEFFNWARAYDAASAATVDRDEEIDKACEFIEHSLTILGATALEDKLQEGVPDAIEMLHRAGIKLWILTGDKLQTAIEIGYSCNLLTNDMEVMIISADSEDGARAQIEAGLNKIASVLGPPPVRKGRRVGGTPFNPLATFAVVIDGDSLRYALEPSLKGLFLALGTQCSAVVCCRVSPSQKAMTVKLVKDGCGAMTLSIGDGANDVAMIQEANVGVGLFGLEGSQAAMSADYAFGQFRFLTRLLLVHGRWSYVRVADMHANFFYKNVIWTLSMFWFLIWNSFDATYLFEYTYILLFNLIFTSVPVCILGAFDQDANAMASLAFPQLYKRGIQGLEYTRSRFWMYMLDGLYQSAIIFFIPYLAYGDGSSWSATGRDTNSLWEFGTTIATAGVVAANLYVGINTRYWTYITFAVTIISCLLVYIWTPIYSYLAALPFYGEVAILFPTFEFWSITLFTVFCAVGPRFLVKAFRQSYYPLDKDIVREAWVTGALKVQLGLRPGNTEEPNEAPMSIAELASSDSKADSRGLYEPAALMSPQRTGNDSPAPSDDADDGRLHPFSYPPNAHTSRTSSPRQSLAPQSRNSPGPSRRSSYISSPLVSGQPPDSPAPATPMSDYSYTSPSAISFNSPGASGPDSTEQGATIPPPMRYPFSSHPHSPSPPALSSQITSPWEHVSPASQPAQLEPTHVGHGFHQSSVPDDPAWEVVGDRAWQASPTGSRTHQDSESYGQAF